MSAGQVSAIAARRLRSITLSPQFPGLFFTLSPFYNTEPAVPAACVLLPRSPHFYYPEPAAPAARGPGRPRCPCRPHLLQATLAARTGESGEGRQDGLAQRHGWDLGPTRVRDTGEWLPGAGLVGVRAGGRGRSAARGRARPSLIGAARAGGRAKAAAAETRPGWGRAPGAA